MKTKIYIGMLALAMGLSFTSCEDEAEYSVATKPLVTESSVVTGSSDVTATTAVFNGTVAGVEQMNSAAYKVGFNYGNSAEALVNSVNASLVDGAITAEVTGLQSNTTIYYQAYVTLQGKITYTGEVKSLVTTDAKVITSDASSIDFASAVVGAKYADAPDDALSGIVIAVSSDVEAVRGGLVVASKEAFSNDMSMTISGLLPNVTYYYAGYLDLGSGIIYGEVKEFTTSEYNFDLDNDLVDLGLSVRWARFNVGAKNETDLGGLFGFGDLTGVSNSIDPVDYASANIYKTTQDVVYKATGGKATLPTAEEFEELFSLCTSEWIEQDGVMGYKFTGPNGNSIFMPAAGSRTISKVSEQGVKGRYATGSISSNAAFAVSYEFGNGLNARSTSPVYEALSVRGVSVAKNVPFNKELLYNKWEIDLTEEGEYQIFPGPVYYYGTDDSWATVTNNEPKIGDVWNWSPDFAGNSWVVDNSAANCRGTMEFFKGADGSDSVRVVRVDAEGKSTEVLGAFTVNEVDKTITLDVDILAPANFTPEYVSNLKTDLKILSQTKNSIQIAPVRTNNEGPCLLSINYVSSLYKNGYTAKLTCYGGNDDTTPDAWSSAILKVPGGDMAVGTYTLTFNTEYPRTCGKVFLLDIEGLAAASPNALVRIDSIRADGKDVKFDASKFYYGDIENNGTYRVEMANIWGKGGNGNNGLKDTPFREEGGEVTEETALAFESTFEVVFTVVSVTSNGVGTYTPNLITINPSWGGTWGFNKGATFDVVYENFQYKFGANTSFDITYESADHSAGSIMTFIETKDVYSFFPGITAQLDAMVLDGAEKEFDASKVLNVTADGAGVHHRLEVWNQYGETSKSGCAFGDAVEGTVAGLGFSSSMQMKFTYVSLFKNPWK